MSIKDTIRRSYEAMSRGDAAGYAAAFAEGATLVDPLFPGGLRGREAIQAATEAMLKTFPDLSATVRSIIESGNRAAVEATYRGTNDGPLAMPGGELPPTGRQVPYRWSSAMRALRTSTCSATLVTSGLSGVRIRPSRKSLMATL